MNRSFLITFYYILASILILLFSYPQGYFVLNTKENGIYKNYSNTDMEIIDKSIGAFVINLERSKERYAYIKNNLDLLGFPVERIDAIDGNTLSAQEIQDKTDLEAYKQFLGHSPKLGTIGCSMSHIKAWKIFLASNFEFAIIFEDDISFDPNKLLPAVKNLIKNTQLWDVNTFEISHDGTPLTIKSFPNDQKLVVYLTEVSHAGAYIINRQAAQKLLEKAFPIKMPIDHYFTRAWEFKLKFTGIEPRLVYQTFGASDISLTKKLPQEKKNFFSITKHCMYKLQSYVIRLIYNLKIYFEHRQVNGLSG